MPADTSIVREMIELGGLAGLIGRALTLMIHAGGFWIGWEGLFIGYLKYFVNLIVYCKLL